MSVENVKVFYEKIINDEKFNKRFKKKEKELVSKNGNKDIVKAIEEILPFLNEEIGEISFKDFKEFEKELKHEYRDDQTYDRLGIINICDNQGTTYDLMQKKTYLECDVLGIGFGEEKKNKCISFGI